MSSISDDLRTAALRLPPLSATRKAGDPGDQAARQPARPGARLFAGRRRGLRGDRRGSGRRPPSYTVARQPRRASSPTAPPCSGLGDIGPLAAKPVMEGKAVLFKKFAGIDVLRHRGRRDATSTSSSTWSRALEPTFGGINLEDIKAPECFEIEAQLRERMKIPVFHDDQHGTAIIVGAAVLNALELAGKSIDDVKIVASGAGAAALACLNLLVVARRAAREHLGHRHRGRRLRGPHRTDGPLEGASMRRRPTARTLADVIAGADIFLGLSAGGVLKPEMVERDGAEAADPGARQSRPGDHAGGGARRRARTR